MKAGIGIQDVALPGDGQLAGYPLVSRRITGVHDPLRVSALHLRTGQRGVLLIAIDAFGLEPYTCGQICEAVEQATSVRRDRIFLGCTQTHSAPTTVWSYAWKAEEVTARPDTGFIEAVKGAAVSAAASACATTRPVEMATVVAGHDLPGTGGRTESFVLALREPGGGADVVVAPICGIRPCTVGGGSTLISADFPAHVREEIAAHSQGPFAVLHFTAAGAGPGPMDPAASDPFAGAESLGRQVGRDIVQALKKAEWESMERELEIEVFSRKCEMSFRQFPAVTVAEKGWRISQMELEKLEVQGGDPVSLWTARRNLGQAEGILNLARQREQGGLDNILFMYGAAEVKVLKIDRLRVAGWSGLMAPCFVDQLSTRMGRSIPVAGNINGCLPGDLVDPDTEARGEFALRPSPFAAAGAEQMVEAAASLIGTG